MLETDLKAKLSRIFGYKKTSFDQPDDKSLEQEVLFINITSCRSHAREGNEYSRAEGIISVFVSSEKQFFGFFNKRIQQADSADTKDFFFYNIDQNEKYFGNLVERRCNFRYFHRAQYDPDHGELNEMEFDITMDGD